MINPEAVQRYLDREFDAPVLTKHVDPDVLRQMIKTVTGVSYREHTVSRPHQLEGLAFALAQRRAMLFFWMRLGKSKMALDWATQLKRGRLVRKKGLILTHAPIGSDVWMGQVAAHSDLRAVVVRAGPTASEALCTALDGDADLIIISRSVVQALFTQKRVSRKGVNKLYPDHEALADAASYIDYAIIDETHFYGNAFGLPYALAKGLVKEARYRVGLTGTPVGRNPFTIWAQASLIDDKFFGTSYPFFEQVFGTAKYSPFTRREVYEFNRKMMPQFQRRLDALSMSYGPTEVKSAPILKGQVTLTMHKEQRKAYNELARKIMKLHMEQRDEITNSFIAMRQISSGYLPFVDEDGEQRVIHYPSCKLDWLKEFASELAPGIQVVVFHEYIHTGELICAMLDKEKITNVALRGETKHKADVISAFNSGKKQFLVANAAAGGTGIDLPAADVLIFFESPVSPITRAQAAARPMNRGDRVLALDDIVCSPIETKILEYIEQGANLLNTLLKGKRASLEA